MAGNKVKRYPAYYSALEVSPRARRSVITAAYTALAKEVHPERKNGDEALFKLIAEAHETLSDGEKRAKYDGEGVISEGTVIGNYRIIKEIASGGFGTTYLGENTLVGEPVCVKHCHHVSAAYESTLIEEAKAIWDLRHYSLPVMRDFLRLEDGSLALVLSYIPGATIEQIVVKNGRLDAEHVTWMAERTLNGLMYLHYNGVVHGDVKPQNIIVQPKSHQLVLVDFGLSLVKPKKNSDPKGYTPVFSSPEQLNGSPLVPESDIYSLGMTMLYALSGTPEAAVRMDVPKETPDALCEFIQSLIVRSVRERPIWKRENLCETIQQVRLDSFGRKSSEMKPIPGF
jgi:serine/threonine protein kinase